MGFLLAQLGIAEDQLKKIKRRLGPIRSFIPWIPGQAAKGTVDREWGLIVNGTIPRT
jgi:hypothetical protein